jgi:hypothetical protein
MFIALPSQAHQPKPQTLGDEENRMLPAAFAPGNPPPGLTYQSDDLPAQGMALLAILTHELGHLLLADTNLDGTGDPANGYVHGRSDPGGGNCDTTENTCFERRFLSPPGVGTTLWNRTLRTPRRNVLT